MTPQQALIVFIGLMLVGLSVHEYWRPEYRALLGEAP